MLPLVVHASLDGSLSRFAKASLTKDTNLVNITADSWNSALFAAASSLVNYYDCDDNGENCEPVTKSSLLDSTTEVMAYMFNTRPANSATYVADLLEHNFGLVPSAYAQDTRGLGFAGLQPVLATWKAFRNITYMLFVVFIVMIGFMVMFRTQLNPQTVVTIQAALPKVIITLLLITFSYAIAGFIIDMIFFIIYVVAGLLQLGGVFSSSGQQVAEALLSKSIFLIGFKYFLGFTDAAGRVAYSVNLLVREVFSGGWTNIDGYIYGGISSVIAYLIAAIAIIIAIVRTFFALLKSYVNLILNTITAPFQILLNAMPGSNAFMIWLKKIASDAAVFPVVAIMIMLGIALMGSSPDENIQTASGVGFSRRADGSVGDAGGFAPPFIVPGNSGTANVLQGIIGFGIIMLLPEVVEMVKKTMGVEQSPWGELAMKNAKRGDFISPPLKLGAGVATYVGQQYAAARFMGWRQSRKNKKLLKINDQGGVGEEEYGPTPPSPQSTHSGNQFSPPSGPSNLG